MPQIQPSFLLIACLSAVLGACRANEPAAPEPATAAQNPVFKVQDLAAFDAFIAGRPTPEAFRARYPEVRLVLPGEIATRELRMDRSRYFADLDPQQRIIGGRFQ